MAVTRWAAAVMVCVVTVGACHRRGGVADGDAPGSRGAGVRPGITVLLDDSVYLVRGHRVGLITNQTGVDEHGVSDIDLLTSDRRAVNARVRLTVLFAPEHGIRGTEDRTFVENGVDPRSGVPIYSLYGATTVAPPDSTLRDLDVLVFDLQDIGTRTWTYVGVMVYAMRAAARRGIPFVVLDRPNPLGGVRVDPPLLDRAIANADDHTASRPAQPYALYPVPLRHGMTMGELALLFNDRLGLKAALHVVPMSGWRRGMWFDETKLPWVRPSPNLPSLESALLYPALVWLEGAVNVSVGRGTSEPFQRFGAPWLDAAAVIRLLDERELPGVRFSAERFKPSAPGDGKFDGREVPGIRVRVIARDRIQAGRLAAAILWALGRVHGDSLQLNGARVDLRLGSARIREALLRGEDPDAVIDRELPASVAFAQSTRTYHLYR